MKWAWLARMRESAMREAVTISGNRGAVNRFDSAQAASAAKMEASRIME